MEIKEGRGEYSTIIWSRSTLAVYWIYNWPDFPIAQINLASSPDCSHVFNVTLEQPGYEARLISNKVLCSLNYTATCIHKK